MPGALLLQNLRQTSLLSGLANGEDAQHCRRCSEWQSLPGSVSQKAQQKHRQQAVKSVISRLAGYGYRNARVCVVLSNSGFSKDAAI